MPALQHFYRRVGPDIEYCFNIQTTEPLTPYEMGVLKWLLTETFEPGSFGESTLLVSSESANSMRNDGALPLCPDRADQGKRL